MMNWQFTEFHTLTDSHTGFTIYLLSGGWQYLEEIKPVAPAYMPFLQQAQLLREGLAFAESHRDDLPLYEVIELSEAQYQYAV
jgi:NOL1/NOP2/fmu family ribosome biogenesis protein